MRCGLYIFLLLLTSCKTVTYYVVRHAEKETAISGDVPLSADGAERAKALSDMLRNKRINAIYATPYKRTKATVSPLGEAIGIPVQSYQPGNTAFLDSLKARSSGVFVIAGHSNTVDDIVNRLAGRTVVTGDLPETQYGDLFIVTKKGKKTGFRQSHFGK